MYSTWYEKLKKASALLSGNFPGNRHSFVGQRPYLFILSNFLFCRMQRPRIKYKKTFLCKTVDRFRYILVKLQDKMNVWRMEDESATSKALRGKKPTKTLACFEKSKKSLFLSKKFLMLWFFEIHKKLYTWPSLFLSKTSKEKTNSHGSHVPSPISLSQWGGRRLT